jgi:hypothetical protein
MLQERKKSLFLAGIQSMIPPKGTTIKRNTFCSLLYLRAQFKEQKFLCTLIHKHELRQINR